MKKNSVVQGPWYLSLSAQVLCALATIVLLFTLMLGKLGEFNATDSMPQLLPLVPTKDVSQTGAVANVKTGIFIYDFPTFDMVANKFVVDAIVWFQFDPTIISLDSVGNFMFEKGTIVRRTPPETKMINGELFARYLVRVSLSSTLDYKYFPIDDHRLFIVLTNEFLTPNELRFVVSEAGVGIAPAVFTEGWKPVGKAVYSGYATATLDQHDAKRVIETPRAIFALDFEKPGLRKVLLIFIPIFLMMLLGLFSLIFDHDAGKGSIMSLSVGSLSGLLAYRFVIEKLSPEVGYYTLTEYAYTMILSIIFLLFLFNLYIMSKAYTTQVRTIKFAVFVGTQVAVLCMWYYLLYVWGR